MTTTIKQEGISGVLTGLHRQKAGQYRSLKIVTALTAVWLLVVVALSLVPGDGGHKVNLQKVRTVPLLFGQQAIVPPSPARFSIGHIGKARIVAGLDLIPSPPWELPEFGFVSYPAPGAFESPHQVDSAVDPSSTNYDFGLPKPPPLWRFAERGLPVGIISETVGYLALANLVTPAWPDRVWLNDDTAVVYGLLTMHSYGRMSFEIISENYPGRGFDKAVQNAVAQGTCIPAVNRRGERMTVSCRYRCLFVQGAQPSVSVGSSITAKLKKD